ncbi:hypothetical protein [Methylobacterium mesophilicum]|uniref:hypothetical protein n=1 Tax=Methylobacterium mesophilicum TaxID=39956 RepID=UPI002F33408A
MTTRAHDIDIKFIRQIQQQQIELTLLQTERDRALHERALAQARCEAMTKLVDALLTSFRPFGFDRKRFLASVRRAAQTVPDHAADSVQHSVLHDGSARILRAQPGNPMRP